jgi:uncharacterized protein (DUF305 family)
MNKKEIMCISLGLVVGVVVGLTVNSSSRSVDNRYTEVTHEMTHQMPDGSIMSNDGNSMASMMHDMNKALEGKTGDAFDQAFLSEMIVHHQGAVSMAQQVLKVSKKPELLKLADDIITAQNKEIEMMRGWQK